MSSTSTADLFSTLMTEGEISPEALRATQVVDYGSAIQDAMGLSVGDPRFSASESAFLGVLVDDSSSIRFAGNTGVIIKGCNHLMDVLQKTKQADSIMMMLEMLNKGRFFPFSLLKNTKKLDASNYNPSGGTPLYDKTAYMAECILAKRKESMDTAVPCRGQLLIITDGENVGSVHHTPQTVRALLESLLLGENLVLAMGIDDGHTDFRRVFREMGIPDNCVLVPGNTEKEIFKAFGFASQSMASASQSAANFSKVKQGGFGA